MNAIDDNDWSRGFQKLAKLLPVPQAILSISAHWYVSGTFLTGDEHPRTIHDFGGFPRELYDQQYPAPGSVELAKRVSKLVGKGASLRTDWGLDHGTWTVLKYLRPEADVPVVQLSIDGRLRAAGHLAIGEALAPLREEGVLILGSGNVTHNLRHAFSSWQRGEKQTPPWAAVWRPRCFPIRASPTTTSSPRRTWRSPSACSRRPSRPMRAAVPRSPPPRGCSSG